MSFIIHEAPPPGKDGLETYEVGSYIHLKVMDLSSAIVFFEFRTGQPIYFFLSSIRNSNLLQEGNCYLLHVEHSLPAPRGVFILCPIRDTTNGVWLAATPPTMDGKGWG